MLTCASATQPEIQVSAYVMAKLRIRLILILVLPPPHRIFKKSTDMFLLSLAADCLISDSHIRNVHVCSRDTLRANFEQMLNPAYAFVNL